MYASIVSIISCGRTWPDTFTYILQYIGAAFLVLLSKANCIIFICYIFFGYQGTCLILLVGHFDLSFSIMIGHGGYVVVIICLWILFTGTTISCLNCIENIIKITHFITVTGAQWRSVCNVHYCPLRSIISWF